MASINMKNKLSSTKDKLKGIIIPLVTIFKKGGKYIDISSTRQLLNYVTPYIDGVFLSGTTGGSVHLNKNELSKLIKVCINFRNKRNGFLILVGTPGNTPWEVIDKINFIKSEDIDGIVLSTPYFFQHTNEELLKYFQKIIEKVEDSPLILYNLPQLTNNNLDILIVKKLAQNKKIIGIKDSSGSLNYCKKLLEKTNLKVLQGEEALASKSLEFGANGLVPSAANIFPILPRNLFDQRNNKKISKKLQKDLDYLYSILYAKNEKKANVPGVLTALKIIGIGQGPQCPFTPLSQKAKEKTRDLITKLKNYIPQL